MDLARQLAKLPAKAAAAACAGAALRHKASGLQKQVQRLLHPEKENEITMKKSTFAAVLLFLAAAVGALTAGYLYIRRREKELDEYENLLFSEDFNDEIVDEAGESAEEPGAGE